MPYPALLLAALMLLVPAGARAQVQDLDAVQRVAEAFVRAQTTGITGEVQITAGPMDNRLRLPACQTLEPFLPPGTRLWGSATVGVRCAGGWSIYVPVTVRVTGPAVFAARTLAAGKPLAAEDLAVRTTDLTQLPAGALTDPAEAIGRSPIATLAAGQALRPEQLRAPLAVVQGQTVRLVAQGSGITVSSEGKAMANASAGQTVSVRTASGQLVTGVARPGGIVEVPF